jgi:cytochrome c
MLRAFLGVLVTGVFIACAGQRLEDSPAAALYFNNCAACHGDQGEGDGPVAAVLGVVVPNLRELAARNGGVYPADSARAYIDGRSMMPAHGARYMPVWGDEFSYTQGGGRARRDSERAVQRKISSLVDFLAALQY